MKLLLGLLLLSGAAHTSSVPFEVVAGRDALLFTALVNGKPATVVFDTGAATSMFAPEAAGVDLAKTSNLALSASGASGDAVWVRCDIRIGTKVWKNAPVLATRLDRVSKAYGRRIDGIAGQDLIGSFTRVSLDYARREFVFEW